MAENRPPDDKSGKLESVDISKLRIEDVDQLGHEALKEAVKSILRTENLLGEDHKDHRSHSNIKAPPPK